MSLRKPYPGSRRKLILGIDIGTTYAGLSYSLLEPGRIPDILPVTRFPAQDHIGGDSKVPSIIYYDRSGRVRQCGAEALQESVVEQAAREGWEKAEWFKLHLRPNTLPPIQLPPLPRTKTVVDVFADFLQYLFRCAKRYITDFYPNGGAMWSGLESDMEFVLTHPNGWEGEQQYKMRMAAIMAGLIPNTTAGQTRLQFVTEGEASLHFCIMNGLATDPLRLGNGVVIIDAGGGTIDISAYRKVISTSGSETFEEVAQPQCLFAGSMWVSSRARDYLAMQLRGSRYAEDVDHIRECFDKTTKLRFRRTKDLQYIKFGRYGDNHDALNISNGQLKLKGEVVAGFFKPALDQILAGMAMISTQTPVSSVLLVGGFGASDWLYTELKRHLKVGRLDVYRPDSHVNKAVADGAIYFHLSHLVSVRVSKHTYGIECRIAYNSSDPEHHARRRSAVRDAAGDLMLTGVFSPILRKNTRVSETQEFRQRYTKLKSDRSLLSFVKIPIIYFRGQSQEPRWMDVEPAQYQLLCTVHADTSRIARNLRQMLGSKGMYYRLDIDVVLSFCLTEIKAGIAWFENGSEQRGPAELVY